MEVIKQIGHALGHVLGSYFNSDLDVMSPEARKIFSNAEDRQKYIQAVDKLKSSKSTQETIHLSNNETIVIGS